MNKDKAFELASRASILEAEVERLRDDLRRSLYYLELSAADIYDERARKVMAYQALGCAETAAHGLQMVRISLAVGFQFPADLSAKEGPMKEESHD